VRALANVRNTGDVNDVTLTSGERSADLPILPKSSGFGSSPSGGDLLRLAPAACATNDIYCEAGRLGIAVPAVEVEACAELPVEDHPARAIEHTVRITARAPEAKTLPLAARAHRLAEIQGTVRQAIPVTPGHVDAVPTA
jgi:hypothetical protein